MTPRNKLTYLMNFDSAWNVNMKNELGVEQEAQQNRKAGLSGLWGLIWESLLTDDLVFRSQAAYSKRPQYWYPWACEDGKLGECDAIPGIDQQVPPPGGIAGHRRRLRRHRRVLRRQRRSPTAATTCTSTRRSTGCSTSSTARRWASTAWC